MVADAEDSAGGEEGAGGEDTGAKKKLPGKVLVLFIGGPLLVIIIGAVLYLFVFSGGGKDETQAKGGAGDGDYADYDTEGAHRDEGHGDGTKKAHWPEPLKPEDAIFVELPDLLVNLKTAGDRPVYLKLKVALEVHKETDTAKLEETMTRVIDKFTVYLREMRSEDLNGSAGLFRLKEELLHRVNLATHPIRVHDVLFKEMLVQ